MQAKSPAALAIEIARFQLLRGRVTKTGPVQPQWVFLAHLLHGLKDVEEPGLETMATDGVHLFYDPVVTEWWSPLELIAVTAHEGLHCALDHPGQFAGQLGDDAVQLGCDAPINLMLRMMALELPGTPIVPGEREYAWLPLRLTTPEYIELLRKQEQPKGKDGQGQPQPGQDASPGAGEGEGEGKPGDAASGPGGKPHGQFRAPPKDTHPGTLKRAWQVRVLRAEAAAREAATRATGRGDLPGYLEEFIGAVTKSRIPWEETLREWMQHWMPAAEPDYSSFSRRWLGHGHYFPKRRTRRPGSIVMAVDRSGSMDRGAVARVLSQVFAVGELQPTALHVLVHDRDVVERFHWETGEPDLVLPEVLKGGGGTSHRPVLEEAAEYEPDIIICGTDLDTSFPDTPPDAPVLWVSTKKDHRPPPWGEVLLACD